MTSPDLFQPTNDGSVDAYDQLSLVYDGLIPDPDGFVDFYTGVCGSTPCRVLYVGCGTGRLLETLARGGHECVGVDPSSESVEIARRRLEEAGVPSEVRVDRLPELAGVQGNFDVAVVAGGAFEYLLTTRDQVSALRRIASLLAPGGCLALDVSVPPFATDDARGNYRGDMDEELVREVGLQSSEVRFGYDHFLQLVRSTCTFNFGSHRDPLTVEYMTRYTTRAEWQLLLEVAGLRGRVFGDFHQGPVTRRSSNLVVLAERDGQ
ncbi:bifunctional 2-polyprenyl-6-hydroxyphenol methylase/3-demethylubiquinol 3-O-methyltransferase UbiG [Micrococcus sp. FDAARGOS_333]|uniref:class I SAM-dependent methyltransferase n=1 Tax=Micrococcus sp. FDAARGOS_333 TaxID=1930558 RepID=UPI000B4E4191|nr:class I SAM-dependent methyltransferase [Micrococcus sp. FDAARGOS_333]PNL17588.1 class I SAM-dependent methyltransferase [Micrococcus sp. FDAARGOS_333]